MLQSDFKKIILLLVIFLTGTVNAQLFPNLGGQRSGISTAQFLKLGIGSRASSLGDAFVAISDDASSLYWNPAGITQFNTNEVMFSHNQWVVDINHDFLGAVWHLTPSDAVGLSFTSVTMDKMKVTTEFAPFGTGEFFAFSDIAIGVTYAKKMTDQFSFGATIRYMEETLDKLKMRGVLIDLGTFYWTGLGTSRFAVSVTNFGNQLAPDGEITLVGKRKKSDWQSFSPPTMFRFGIAFEPYQDEHQMVTTSFQLNHPNDNSENLSFGTEYVFNSFQGLSLALRGGYKFNVIEQDFTFGAGIKYNAGFSLLTFDYAYAGFERLGSSHRISVSIGIL
ncbi:MAG: hypothetical protein AMXMBFR48_01110 [Ignavibacteriales bacterium]